MIVVRTIQEVRDERQRHSSVALVPTMGALHEGHLELIRRAGKAADSVFVSIFVNPTQFAPGDDFETYPRDEQGDLAKCSSAGASVVFLPSVEEMYGSSDVRVLISGVGDLYEGAHRPGHFDGVATVVLKLFNIVEPDVAVFGLKDLQQCAVIRALVDGLDLDVRLELVETVRSESGLALSSRNAYFSDLQRDEAAQLYRVLSRLADQIRSNPGGIDRHLSSAQAALKAYHFEVEYLDCVSHQTMRPARDSLNNARIIVASRFYGVRLIDNVPIVQ